MPEGLFGGGKTTQRTTPDPASPEEQALQAEALVTAQIRNQLLREQITAQTATFGALGGQLEAGIAGTLAEEGRFGILAGETLGPGAVDTGTGAAIRTFLQEPPAGPPSAQIGAPGAPSADVARLEAELREAEQQFPDQFIPSPPGSLLRQGEEDSGPIPARTIVNPRVAELRRQLETAKKETAIQRAVQVALAERPGQPVPQELIDRLEQLVAQTPPADAEATPEGEGIRQQLFQKQLDLIEQGGRATEQDIADIKRAADAASAEGAESISNFAERMLLEIRDVFQPARGLRPQDTPIRGELGGRVGAEATRQFGELQARLRTVQAERELTLPLARQGFQSQLVGFQQNLAQAAREFQVGLRQQAFENRLRLAATRSGAFGTLLGTPGVNIDFPRGSTTTTKQPVDILGSLAKVGDIAVAAKTVGFISSSRDFKHKATPVKADDILQALIALPIQRWQYKPQMRLGTERHVGPYAEDFKAAFGVGDGEVLSVVDVMGVMLTVVKTLATRVQELEHANAR